MRIAHPNVADSILANLFERYASSRRPLSVNFRKIVDWAQFGDRATHYIHPYPAKLLPHIPALFLANNILSKPGDTVLDPFCGSGTVLLESVLHGREGLGVDANPLARLIASAKVTRAESYNLRLSLEKCLRSASRFRTGYLPTIPNIDYWFYPHVVAQLSLILRAVREVDDSGQRDFLLMSFSATVRKVSLADPRLSVPVRLRSDQYPKGHTLYEETNARLRRLRRQDVFSIFTSIVSANIARVDSLHALNPKTSRGRIIGTDARKLRNRAYGTAALATNSISLILTSPPYVGAQKYVRASSLSIAWLELANGKSMKELHDVNIGREHFLKAAVLNVESTSITEADRKIGLIRKINPLRALIAETYLREMSTALEEQARVLRPGGYLVMVVGNNRICGKEFQTQRFLQKLAENAGLVSRLRLLDSIKSRGLMTKRNSTASMITREWVHVLQKPV